MSAAFHVFLLFAAFVGMAEMCGNLHSTETPATVDTSSHKPPGDRKRRSAGGSTIVHIELQTTLTSAGEVEFSKIENELTEEYQKLLDKAHRQVTTGFEGASVLKYMFTDADCGIAQLFAQSAKDLSSFVTGATIRCNGQTSHI
ncbi:Protein CBG16562 [Caenorhabditis briggsae]|uniref:Protein CBG16562 n=2 Tax=Caenorhabditis briggsae TaxID=6238 RepID=A8XPH2_CAEBR|nr:Protein CBG16562 [Caenorhabditis briggsae]ULU01116.1 hypothetical protein L3Y34_001471 [Caenorhabditis briggsae]CAP34493.1 Protein CBG16562 [Caenorhabditis briggsae]